MEQTLLPPSQTRLTSMSIDSRFADQYFHGTADFSIRLPNTMRNVMRIALSSVELPAVAYVFSAKAGNTCFTVTHDGSGEVIDISEGNYTPEQLADAVSAALESYDIVCSYDPIANRFRLSNMGVTAVSLTLTCDDPLISPCAGPCKPGSNVANIRFWGLGYNMGFRTQTVVIPSGETVVACESPQIAPPPYMLLQVRCPDMLENTLHRTASGSFVPALAKLILRSGAYSTQFDDASDMVRKENVFPAPTSLTQLRVSLVDAYGRLVDMGDTDWSMTFEIMEIVSSCQYSELGRGLINAGRC